jgi:hypothetical protein
MQKRHLQGLLTAMLASLLLWSPVADAGINFFLSNKAPPEIKIWVGKKNKISTVSFTVDPVELGNGTPIESSNRPIHIQVQIRSTAANPLTGILTVDSLSDPLKNTASSTTIPFSEISWTADDDDIPSGVYQETINQPLVSFQSSQRVRDRHTFSYANSMVIEAGTYKGSVKYTWAVP